MTFAPRLARVLDLLFDLLALVVQVQRTHPARPLRARARPSSSRGCRASCADERVVDRVVHEQALDAEAHLAAVEEAADVGHSSRPRPTSASSHTIIGSLPPSSSVTRLISRPATSITWRPTSVEPVKAMRRTRGLRKQLLADFGAGAGHDVDRPRRQLLLAARVGRLLDQLDRAAASPAAWSSLA